MAIDQKVQYATSATVDGAFSQSAAIDLKARRVTSANKTEAVICFRCRVRSYVPYDSPPSCLSSCVAFKMPTASADNDVHLERHSRARSEGTLGAVFEHEENLLRKVLVHLVDDGLHECRRVCRFWRDVCSTLPVKLREAPPGFVPVLLSRFPRATSLDVCYSLWGEDDVARHGISLLPRLKHLRRLHLSSGDREEIPAGRQWWLGPMDSLIHLSLGITSQMAYRNAIEAIRKLTQIESLRLDFDRPFLLDPHPITEVWRLKP